jgi:hypothetical protein
VLETWLHFESRSGLAFRRKGRVEDLLPGGPMLCIIKKISKTLVKKLAILTQNTAVSAENIINPLLFQKISIFSSKNWSKSLKTLTPKVAPLSSNKFAANFFLSHFISQVFKP